MCESIGAEIVCRLRPRAPPSGRVEDDAFEYIAQKIVAAAAEGCDAIMLDLHGAMVTKTYDDGEGELLRRIRAVAPRLPIAVALDMHANLYPAMVAQRRRDRGVPDVSAHRHGRDRAPRRPRAAADARRAKPTPTMVWGNAPMLPHVMRQGTDDFPNAQLQARAREMEREGALAVSLFTGFPHADIEQAGLSVVVVTDGDRAGRDAGATSCSTARGTSAPRSCIGREPLTDSVARAKALGAAPGDGPVILLDHYDNTASGGTMDTTEVLAEILRQGLEDVAVFGIFDPDAVQEMVRAGVGGEGNDFAGRQAGDAVDRTAEPAVDRHGPRQADLRRRVSGHGRDVARADDEHGHALWCCRQAASTSSSSRATSNRSIPAVSRRSASIRRVEST